MDELENIYILYILYIYNIYRIFIDIYIEYLYILVTEQVAPHQILYRMKWKFCVVKKS